MLFKNAIAYRLQAAIDMGALAAAMEEHRFQPCGSQDLSREGWDNPIEDVDQLVVESDDCHLLCLRIQEKIIPSAAVDEKVAEKVKAIEKAEARTVYRKERKQIKDEVSIELLPKALTKSRRVHAYINLRDRLVVVNTGSHNAAERLLTQARITVGSLPLVPLATNGAVYQTMTEWVRVFDTIPTGWALGDSCDLQDTRELSNTIKVRGQDLQSDEVLQHLEVGKAVSMLGLRWTDHLSFTLRDTLVLSGLKFADELVGHEDIEHPLDLAAADLKLLSATVGTVFNTLLTACGGEIDHGR